MSKPVRVSGFRSSRRAAATSSVEVLRPTVVAPERRRKGVAGGLAVAAEGAGDERRPVDRAGQRLAHADVRSGPRSLFRQRNATLRPVRESNVTSRVASQPTDAVLAQCRGDVDLAGEKGGDQGVLVGEPPEHDAPQAGRAGPVVGVRLQLHLAGPHRGQSEGARADGAVRAASASRAGSAARRRAGTAWRAARHSAGRARSSTT